MNVVGQLDEARPCQDMSYSSDVTHLSLSKNNIDSIDPIVGNPRRDLKISNTCTKFVTEVKKSH